MAYSIHPSSTLFTFVQEITNDEMNELLASMRSEQARPVIDRLIIIVEALADDARTEEFLFILDHFDQLLRHWLTETHSPTASRCLIEFLCRGYPATSFTIPFENARPLASILLFLLSILTSKLSEAVQLWLTRLFNEPSSPDYWTTIQHQVTVGVYVFGDTRQWCIIWQEDSIRGQCVCLSFFGIESISQWIEENFTASSFLLLLAFVEIESDEVFSSRRSNLCLPLANRIRISLDQSRWLCLMKMEMKFLSTPRWNFSFLEIPHRSVDRCLCSFRIASFADQSLLFVYLPIRSFSGVEHVVATDRQLDFLLSSK